MTKTQKKPPAKTPPVRQAASKSAAGTPSLNIWRPQAGTNQYNCCRVLGGVLDGASGNTISYDASNPLQAVWGLVVRGAVTPDLATVQRDGKSGTVMGGYMWQINGIPVSQPGPDNRLVVYGAFQQTGPMSVPVAASFYGCPY